MSMGPTDDIKSRLNIVDVIQGYLKLEKAGMNLKANCPFHSEKTPSFTVSPTKQMWYCFGCSQGGDMFKFVMEIEGYGFPEALKLLADRAGIQLKKEDPNLRSERNRLYDISEAAAVLFTKNLASSTNVLSYLKKRGLTANTINQFRLGYAPNKWDFLLPQLLQKGFTGKEVVTAGLAVRSDQRASLYDRFRDRIMFPIADAAGRVIAFGGRIFEEDSSEQAIGAKYVNSPATPIYDKSRVLYGFDRAKQDIRRENTAVIVEGYMDCIMSHQAGVTNTIAVSGTALTAPQLTFIKRLAETIISSFDTDSAGEYATRRSLTLAAQFEFARKIANIPSGKDPADSVRENPEEWMNAVKNAKPVIEFYFEKAFREHDSKSADGKRAITEVVLPHIAEVINGIEKAHWVGELAKRFGVREDAVWNELGRHNLKTTEPFTSQPVTPSPNAHEVQTRKQLLEERFLTVLTAVSPEIRQQTLSDHRLSFMSNLHNEIFEHLEKGTEDKNLTPHVKEQIALFQLKAETLSEVIPNLKIELVSCRRELEKHCLKEELEQVGTAIQQKESDGSKDEVTALLKQFRDLSTKLQQLA